MKITVFYRSNEASNRYTSSTRSETDLKIKEWDKIDIKVGYENLDKRKYQNYFKKFGVPEYVFVWHDEEILIDYIKENYPATKIELMCGKDREYNHPDHTYDNTGSSFTIYNRIVNIVNTNIEKIIIFKIKTHSLTIEKEELPINKLQDNHYRTELEAKDAFKLFLERNIETCEEGIERNNRTIKKYTEVLKSI